MRSVRWALSCLMIGGALAPLGPHALAHAWSDSHSHRHEDGVAHSHRHEAGHHQHEMDQSPSCVARLLPSRVALARSFASVPAPAAFVIGAPRRPSSRLAASQPTGAPPGGRASLHLGRAPPA